MDSDFLHVDKRHFNDNLCSQVVNFLTILNSLASVKTIKKTANMISGKVSRVKKDIF